MRGGCGNSTVRPEAGDKGTFFRPDWRAQMAVWSHHLERRSVTRRWGFFLLRSAQIEIFSTMANLAN
jgi:hypothetical protein